MVPAVSRTTVESPTCSNPAVLRKATGAAQATTPASSMRPRLSQASRKNNPSPRPGVGAVQPPGSGPSGPLLGGDEAGRGTDVEDRPDLDSDHRPIRHE